MAVVSIDNFPDELYAKLNLRAQQNGRVVSDEIIEAARRFVGVSEATLTSVQKLALADKIRTSTAGARIDDEIILRSRHEGRSPDCTAIMANRIRERAGYECPSANVLD